jgi:signal peptidase I
LEQYANQEELMSQTTNKEKRRRRWLRRSVLILCTLCLVVLAARSSLVRAYRLGGASAAPTLCVGDMVWVNLAAYDLRVPFTGWIVFRRAEPERGDLVLCALPGERAVGIKRVLGLGGDTVEFRDDRLVVNGREASYEEIEPSHFHDITTTNRLGDRFAIERIDGSGWVISYLTDGSTVSSTDLIIVPEYHYLLVGDNRANSWDSRFQGFGCVPRPQILGRVIGTGRPVPEASD